MSFSNNWPAHLTAALSADVFSHRLAQDFWPEKLFDPTRRVNWHWVKLFWVFFASALAQLTLIGAVIAIGIDLYKTGGTQWKWSLYLIGGITAFGVVMAMIISTAVWIDIRRHQRTMPK